jgi:hypothetical protein
MSVRRWRWEKHMRRFMVCLAAGWGIALFSEGAIAVGCNADEVEVYRDKTKIVCVDREEYAACIGKAGADMRDELSRSCGAVFKNCFSDWNLDISLQAAACLGGALAGCGVGQVACVQVCNLALSAQELRAYHSCTAQLTPCYEQALINDRARKERCKGL